MLVKRWIIRNIQDTELSLTFSDWLKDRGLGLEFEEYPEEVMNAKLRSFFAELRNGKGETYSKSSMVSIRAGPNRHLRSPPFNRVLNLMYDREFQGSNQVLPFIFAGVARRGYVSSPRTVFVRKWIRMGGLILLGLILIQNLPVKTTWRL